MAKHYLFLLLFSSISTSSVAQVQLGQDIDGEANGDEFGISVSMNADGNRVAVGARYNDNDNGSSGHVRIYDYNTSNGWIQLGNDIDGEANADESGYSVSLSGNGSRVAIGAPKNELDGHTSGHVRVYGYESATGWQQVGADIDADIEKGRFGTAVSLSSDGSILAIGAPLDGVGSEGMVRVYNYNETNGWQQLGEDIVGGFLDHLGTSVSLSADGFIVAIGGPVSVGGDMGRGHAWVYGYDATNGWGQLGTVINGEGSSDGLGSSVSLSSNGSRLAVGAPGSTGVNGERSGRVKVFDFDASVGWQQVGANIDGEQAFDRSGISVSLSDDGSVLAVGSIFNYGNGSLSGHVRLYSYDASSDWEQVGQDIDGEQEGDASGGSVSLSADGSIVAIGARQNDGANGLNSGHTRIFAIEAPLSITEIVDVNNISIHPNPNYDGLVIFDIPQAFGTTIQVTVVELGSGKLVKNFTAIAGTNQVAFNGLANGVYIINIVSESAASTHRLILAK